MELERVEWKMEEEGCMMEEEEEEEEEEREEEEQGKWWWGVNVLEEDGGVKTGGGVGRGLEMGEGKAVGLFRKLLGIRMNLIKLTDVDLLTLPGLCNLWSSMHMFRCTSEGIRQTNL